MNFKEINNNILSTLSQTSVKNVEEYVNNMFNTNIIDDSTNESKNKTEEE